MISLFISALCDGRRPTIYGDGEQTRDFTYVANVVDGVLRACHAPNASGEVINVATAAAFRSTRSSRRSATLVGVDVSSRCMRETRAGDVRDSQADITKAETLLGYRPSVSFETGLERTVAWYRETRSA